MTDRELLELAAKAAGIDDAQYAHDSREYEGPCIWSAKRFNEFGSGYWNPLTHDGDAFRLSNELAIDVLHRFVGGRHVEALAPGGPVVEEFCDERTVSAATRRAIVRASAEIGRKA